MSIQLAFPVCQDKQCCALPSRFSSESFQPKDLGRVPVRQSVRRWSRQDTNHVCPFSSRFPFVRTSSVALSQQVQERIFPAKRSRQFPSASDNRAVKSAGTNHVCPFSSRFPFVRTSSVALLPSGSAANLSSQKISAVSQCVSQSGGEVGRNQPRMSIQLAFPVCQDKQCCAPPAGSAANLSSQKISAVSQCVSQSGGEVGRNQPRMSIQLAFPVCQDKQCCAPSIRFSDGFSSESFQPKDFGRVPVRQSVSRWSRQEPTTYVHSARVSRLSGQAVLRSFLQVQQRIFPAKRYRPCPSASVNRAVKSAGTNHVCPFSSRFPFVRTSSVALFPAGSAANLSSQNMSAVSQRVSQSGGEVGRNQPRTSIQLAFSDVRQAVLRSPSRFSSESFQPKDLGRFPVRQSIRRWSRQEPTTYVHSARVSRLSGQAVLRSFLQVQQRIFPAKRYRPCPSASVNRAVKSAGTIHVCPFSSRFPFVRTSSVALLPSGSAANLSS